MKRWDLGNRARKRDQGKKLGCSLLCLLSVFAAVTGFGQMTLHPLYSLDANHSETGHPQAALIQGADGAFYGTTEYGGTANAGTVFKIDADGSGFAVLHSFMADPDGSTPCGRLVQGPDGMLYGTTVLGGSNNVGTIFSLETNGNNFTLLHHFSTNALDGAFPHGSLVLGADGNLYGTTAGSSVTNGVIYRLNPDGTGFTVLISLSHPDELLQGSDGLLYGISETDVDYGLSNSIAIFGISTNGMGYRVLTNFISSAADGSSHHTGLIQGTDGLLYGTFHGATGTPGFLFSINTNGGSFTVLHAFSTNSDDGLDPDCRVYQGSGGVLYGTTVNGGTNGDGTIFRINTNGSSFALLHSFDDAGGGGRWPCDTLLQTADGALYGVTKFGGSQDGGVIFKADTSGNAFVVLWNFKSYSSEGQRPAGALVLGSGGSFYGVTAEGGANNNGTIFKYAPSAGTYTVLHDFTGANGDGQWPRGGLFRSVNGAFYGVTSLGGSNDDGTIFKINGDGTGYRVVFSFSADQDGALPSGPLIESANGLLLGLAGAGGTNQAGCIFEINTNGSDYTVLHYFSTNGMDGWGPVGGLVRGADGAFYGATADGPGTDNAGTVFKINDDGAGYAILHSFPTNNLNNPSYNVDGSTPFGGLLAVGNELYGTTHWGGTANVGILFQISDDGTRYSVVHNFQYSSADAQQPMGDMVSAADGAIYGTSHYGGMFAGGDYSDNDAGTIFELCPDGMTTALVASFCKTNSDGSHPAPLTGTVDGSLYGAMESGGAQNDGVLLEIAPGVPEILTQPTNLAIVAGHTAAFNVGAVGGNLRYQWLYQGGPVTNAQSSSLILPDITRADAGIYSVLVSNSISGVVSSNAVLRVLVAQTLSKPTVLPDGTFQLLSGYADGWPVSSNELSQFSAMVSSNLATWNVLSNSLAWSNGIIVLRDADATNHPVRFYRIEEQ